ncbi:MAG: FHA domain-containing protein [Anaerolineales bacterium]|nr:FHA domain-containing protein [Anaerolineales bacterium]
MRRILSHNRTLIPHWKACIIFILIVVALSVPSLAWSQSVIESLVITKTDATDYPKISLQVLARDASGTPVDTLTSDDLTVYENDEEQNITSVEPFDAGVRIAVVIDPGDGSFQTGVTLTDLHARVLNDMEIFAVGRPWMEAGSDEVMVIVQEGEETNIVLEPTSDPSELLGTLERYIPPVGAASEPPQLGYYTRAALLAALKELSIMRPGYADRFEAIILYTPGMRADLTDVAEEAISLGIPIHIILTRPMAMEYWAEALRPLARVTGGEFLATYRRDDPEDLFELLASQRIQHIVNYETTLATSDPREVILRASSGVSDSASYSVELHAPEVVILSPEEEAITRQASSEHDSAADAEPAFITVEAQVSWPDGTPRKISQARLLVDGVAIGQTQSVGNQLEFPWDIRTYSNESWTLVSVEVEVVDEFGFRVKSPPRTYSIRYMPVEGEVVAPVEEAFPLPVSRDVLLYAFGGVALLSLGLALSLFFGRSRVGPALQNAREGFVDFVDRVTGKRTALVARAFLVPLEGFEGRSPKPYEIYGTTAIGRSRRHADLLFHINEEDSPISRLHCTILDEDDHFAIRDEDSSNGTYVNEEKLVPLEPAQLLDGDTIDIAPIERGGLRFLFQLADAEGNIPQPEGEGRETRPRQQIESGANR